MIELLRLILHIIASFFKPRTKLVAEILILRQQLNVLRRQVSKRPQLSNTDRFLFVWLYRWFPSVLSAIAILRPETIIRWHRAGFQSYWRERSRKPVGRPRISAELRNLIGAMSRANHLWGAPHIHGELLKLGFTIAQSTVARYMYRGWPPSQGWRTFLTNHADGIAAVDLFVLPTITFRLLYCLVILRHGRRLWVTFGVTTNPTAEWISRPDHRGVSLGQFTSLSYSGPRHCVRRGLQAAVACHGHSGQADCSSIAVAEPVRRETDRHDPTGMSRPHDRIRGGAPAPDSGSVCCVL
jgi:hypothetical protein